MTTTELDYSDVHSISLLLEARTEDVESMFDDTVEKHGVATAIRYHGEEIAKAKIFDNRTEIAREVLEYLTNNLENGEEVLEKLENIKNNLLMEMTNSPTYVNASIGIEDERIFAIEARGDAYRRIRKAHRLLNDLLN